MSLPTEDHITARDRAFADLVAPFPVATSELVVSRNLLRRMDSKFAFRIERLPDLLAGLDRDYALVIAGSRPLATYRTLYFDTPDLQSFHAHRRGLRPRHKVRIRHYPDRRVSYFEIKTRKSEVFTQKLRIAVPYGIDVMTEHAHALVEAHGSMYRGPLEPQLWTDFQRLTLLGLHSEERFTVDFEMRFGTVDSPIALEGIAIAEVKQASFNGRTPVMTRLRDAGLRPMPVSKYCTAIALTRDSVRMNRLLPALRVIRRMAA